MGRTDLLFLRILRGRARTNPSLRDPLIHNIRLRLVLLWCQSLSRSQLRQGKFIFGGKPSRIGEIAQNARVSSAAVTRSTETFFRNFFPLADERTTIEGTRSGEKIRRAELIRI
jgi:hypothetical protein